MTKSIPDFLAEQYEYALSKVASGDQIQTTLSQTEQDLLATIIRYSESAKGVLTVFVTSLAYKIFHPEQDIRNHQDSIVGGYSGRTFDSRHITPFLKSHKFPAMAESGWLTRSLEQKVPYDLAYTGAISPAQLKTAFLTLLDNVENNADCLAYLNYVLQGLVIKRNQQQIDLAKPTALSISSILNLLEQHFNSSYAAEGASRLPVLAFYAIYQCLLNETKRFEGKKLLPLESHTSADVRSGRIGDIELLDEQGRVFEAIEVKHGIAISLQLVLDAYTKFQTTAVNRYYILSTAQHPKGKEWDDIQAEIQRIKNVHGCQLIVNGIMPSLKYYLRLLNNSFEFIECYVNLLENDAALKFEHKAKWNLLISDLT
jgi:DNA (cytosine-5)-methyltransferase 1